MTDVCARCLKWMPVIISIALLFIVVYVNVQNDPSVPPCLIAIISILLYGVVTIIELKCLRRCWNSLTIRSMAVIFAVTQMVFLFFIMYGWLRSHPWAYSACSFENQLSITFTTAVTTFIFMYQYMKDKLGPNTDSCQKLVEGTRSLLAATIFGTILILVYANVHDPNQILLQSLAIEVMLFNLIVLVITVFFEYFTMVFAILDLKNDHNLIRECKLNNPFRADAGKDSITHQGEDVEELVSEAYRSFEPMNNMVSAMLTDNAVRVFDFTESLERLFSDKNAILLRITLDSNAIQPNDRDSYSHYEKLNKKWSGDYSMISGIMGIPKGDSNLMLDEVVKAFYVESQSFARLDEINDNGGRGYKPRGNSLEIVKRLADSDSVMIMRKLLYGSFFNRLNLVNADLRSSSFHSSKFIGCNLASAVLDGSDFSYATFVDCNFEGVFIDDPSGEDGEGVVLRGVYIDGSQFGQLTMDENSDYENATLSNTSLTRARFRPSGEGMRLHMTGIRSSHNRFNRVEVKGATIEDALIDGTEYHDCEFNSCDMNGSRFSGVLSVGSKYENCHIKYAYYDNVRSLKTRLSKVDFSDSVFKGVTCNARRIVDCTFSGCVFDGCTFDNDAADRNGTAGFELDDCHLGGCLVRDSEIGDICLNDCHGDVRFYRTKIRSISVNGADSVVILCDCEVDVKPRSKHIRYDNCIVGGERIVSPE